MSTEHWLIGVALSRASAVLVPAAAFLFLSGLVGLTAIKKIINFKFPPYLSS